MGDVGRVAAANAAAPAVRARGAVAQYALSAVLLLRSGVNAAVTIWLLTHAATWSDVFRTGSAYALADGTLGLVTALLVWRREPIGAPPALVAMVLVDAVLRLAVGLAVRTLPGLTLFPITIVLLFGALGIWAAAAGAMAIAGWLIGHEHHRRGRKRTRVHALFDPLTIAGLVAVALAVYALTVGPPTTADALRMTGAVVTGMLTVVFLAALVLEAMARDDGSSISA